MQSNKTKIFLTTDWSDHIQVIGLKSFAELLGYELHTHWNPSFSWSAAPIMLSPTLATWEAIMHIIASGALICFTRKIHKKENKLKYLKLLINLIIKLRYNLVKSYYIAISTTVIKRVPNTKIIHYPCPGHAKIK